MAKSVFYSFHYDNDAWRVQQIMNMGAVEGQPLLNSQEWEAVKKKGKAAIEEWIDEQMAYKKAVIVLIGSETADREWVDYEIRKAWTAKKPLIGVRINGLADSSGTADSAGADPFEKIPLAGGGKISDHVKIMTPNGSTSKDVHADIKANLSSWVDQAYARS
ncbi:TIR domain-containing protein [Rathayibacter sp. AY1F9]|uniref:TIR domain-containing protein n=1 Tax=Rathayibacter sp. AY1F9 TaxID=2080563 RepID=UPI000CE8587D|nr:TIR domain-containing protein [Rathayibacter sp. AY1F9]PPH30328.1 molecular chaperone Tir [Rathayibacter sp. AY1F9]